MIKCPKPLGLPHKGQKLEWLFHGPSTWRPEDGKSGLLEGIPRVGPVGHLSFPLQEGFGFRRLFWKMVMQKLKSYEVIRILHTTVKLHLVRREQGLYKTVHFNPNGLSSLYKVVGNLPTMDKLFTPCLYIFPTTEKKTTSKNGQSSSPKGPLFKVPP